MKKDKEIKRLIHHAKSMGINVIEKGPVKGCIAEFDYNNLELILYLDDKISKLTKIFTIIHELAHAKGFIISNKNHSKRLNKALELYTEHDENIPLWAREAILKLEMNDLKHWDDIIRDCNIKIPNWKIEMQKEIDITFYELFYLLGPVDKKLHKLYIERIKRNYRC